MTDVEKQKQELMAAGVRYLFGAYVDIHGVPKSKAVPVEHLADMAAGSELYTVGALEGMGDLGPNEDECVGVPDLSQLVILPWDRRYAVAPADLLWRGEPYSHDCRAVLRRQLAAAAEAGYGLDMGVEPEVYVIREEEGEWRPFVAEDLLNRPTRGYDLEATIQADAFLAPMIEHMNALGWDVYSFDHEGGDGQYEFDFDYTGALAMADRMLLFRLMAKHVARSLGCVATFMPKPWSDGFGSGAHLNVSLVEAATGRNLFVADGGGYADTAYHFTAGVLRHTEAITAVLCPTVNSYKRLFPYGRMREMSWAPVYQAYGHNNRTLVCRLPMNRRCLEVRHADSACNIYLGAAMTLAAGLEGVREKLDPGEPVEINTYDIDEAELDSRGIRRLPRTLADALDAFAGDDLAKATFGPAFHRTFLDYKRAEWEDYCMAVSAWEREKYLHLW